MNRHVGVLVIAASIVSLAPAVGQLRENPDESLKGLKSVGVVVRYQAPAEDLYGLTQRQLYDAVVARLKAEDIDVVSDDALSKLPGKPHFCVYVVGTEIGSKRSPTFFFSFATDLIQDVTISRKPMTTAEGSTWNQDYALVVPGDDLRQVTLKVSDAAHEFAQSVREANKESTVRGR
jgi:hypothetical protein